MTVAGGFASPTPSALHTAAYGSIRQREEEDKDACVLVVEAVDAALSLFSGHASVSTTQVYTKVDNEILFAMYKNAHPRANLGN